MLIDLLSSSSAIQTSCQFWSNIVLISLSRTNVAGLPCGLGRSICKSAAKILMLNAKLRPWSQLCSWRNTTLDGSLSQATKEGPLAHARARPLALAPCWPMGGLLGRHERLFRRD